VFAGGKGGGGPVLYELFLAATGKEGFFFEEKGRMPRRRRVLLARGGNWGQASPTSLARSGPTHLLGGEEEFFLLPNQGQENSYSQRGKEGGVDHLCEDGRKKRAYFIYSIKGTVLFEERGGSLLCAQRERGKSLIFLLLLMGRGGGSLCVFGMEGKTFAVSEMGGGRKSRFF